MNLGRFKVTIETESLLVISQTEFAESWCEHCRALVPVIGVTAAAAWARLDADELRRAMSDGIIHQIGIEVCVPSLLRLPHARAVRELPGKIANLKESLR